MGLNILGLVAIGVCGITLVLACVAVAIPSWLTADVSGGSVNLGLWKNCVTADALDATVCVTLDLDTLKDGQQRGVKATRAFLIIGILIAPGAMIAGILVLFVMKEKEILFFAAAGCAFAAGFFHMLGFAVFAGEVKDDAFDYGAAFALTIVAWIMSWVVGGLFVGAKIMKTKD